MIKESSLPPRRPFSPSLPHSHLEHQASSTLEPLDVLFPMVATISSTSASLLPDPSWEFLSWAHFTSFWTRAALFMVPKCLSYADTPDTVQWLLPENPLLNPLLVLVSLPRLPRLLYFPAQQVQLKCYSPTKPLLTYIPWPWA